MLRVPSRLLPGPMLQAVRDGPDNLADRVPVPADFEALGHRANYIPGQANAPLGIVAMRRCRARVSVVRHGTWLASCPCSDACETEWKGKSRGAIITQLGEADPPWWVILGECCEATACEPRIINEGALIVSSNCGISGMLRV